MHDHAAKAGVVGIKIPLIGSGLYKLQFSKGVFWLLFKISAISSICIQLYNLDSFNLASMGDLDSLMRILQYQVLFSESWNLTERSLAGLMLDASRPMISTGVSTSSMGSCTRALKKNLAMCCSSQSVPLITRSIFTQRRSTEKLQLLR